MSLPIAWVLRGKPVLVVGGGEVAETRVRKLVPNEAETVVVAPQATEYITELAQRGEVQWEQREFQLDDLKLKHWTFVLTAIDDHELSREIAAACRAQRIPVNVADVIPLCDFYFGANFEQGALKVMVSTGSAAPRLSRRVLDAFAKYARKHKFDRAIETVRRIRMALREQVADPQLSQTRMRLMKTLCDKMSFAELASLRRREITPLLRGMLLSTAACPAHPIGEVPDAIESTDANSESEGSETSESSESESSESSASSEEESKEEVNGDADQDMENAEGDQDVEEEEVTVYFTNDEDWETAQAPNGMKRTATECVEGYPQPEVPDFPFKQHKAKKPKSQKS